MDRGALVLRMVLLARLLDTGVVAHMPTSYGLRYVCPWFRAAKLSYVQRQRNDAADYHDLKYTYLEWQRSAE